MEKDVCHTEEECRELYAGIESGIRQRAVRLLADKICESDKREWRSLLERYGPNEWFYHIGDKYEAETSFPLCPHFGFGMNIRNFMRVNGFGEKELGVHNLDCVYVEFLENAIREA
jgi:hypothetical protein